MKNIGLWVLILFSMPTLIPNNFVLSKQKINQSFELLIAEYNFEDLVELDIASVDIVRFEIKMGDGFETQILSTRTIVSINQFENSGNFDVLTQNSVGYTFFETLLTNGFDDYFDSWIRLDGSQNNVKHNLGDNNETHLVESFWFNRSPDLLGYSLTRISLNINNFSYSSNNGITTISYNIAWQYYGNVKYPNLVEPDTSTKYIMVTSDTLLGFPSTNLTISFSLLFNENGMTYEIPKKDHPVLVTGDQGIYNYNILENETQFLNSLMKDNQDPKIDLIISSTLESGSKISSTVNGSDYQFFFHTFGPEVELTKIVLEVYYLNIQLYFDTVNIVYTLGWFFKSDEIGTITSQSNNTDSLSQTNKSEELESSLEIPKFVRWLVYFFFTITAIVITIILIRRLYY